MQVRIDGVALEVPEGISILDACDAAGRYIPRLCSYPGLGCGGILGVSCGLCVVEVTAPGRENDPVPVLACETAVIPGLGIITSGPALYADRLRRLAAVLDTHPHVCLSCPDRDGCSREECRFGVPAEARCCAEFGRCELGKLVAYIDPGLQLRRWAAVVPRESRDEGRIRREPGLCIGCGRCVLVCSSSPEAGSALQMEDIVSPVASGPAGLAAIRLGAVPDAGGRCRAVPTKGTLRASGCTFCGQCIMVCPTGAVTAPGEAGARWLESCRKRNPVVMPVLPPDSWRWLTEDELSAIPPVPGVFQVADAAGQVLKIAGVADLSRGVIATLMEPTCSSASRLWFERAELFTQRESELLARFVQEHGHLPPGNDLGDDLFGDELFDEDLG